MWTLPLPVLMLPVELFPMSFLITAIPSIGTTPDPKRNGDIFIWKPVPFGAYCAIILKPYVGRPYGEMYDLTNDSLERVNIWDDPEYANAKIRNYGLMMDSMYTATPGHDTPWNYGTPEI